MPNKQDKLAYDAEGIYSALIRGDQEFFRHLLHRQWLAWLTARLHGRDTGSVPGVKGAFDARYAVFHSLYETGGALVKKEITKAVQECLSTLDEEAKTLMTTPMGKKTAQERYWLNDAGKELLRLTADLTMAGEFFGAALIDCLHTGILTSVSVTGPDGLPEGDNLHYYLLLYALALQERGKPPFHPFAFWYEQAKRDAKRYTLLSFQGIAQVDLRAAFSLLTTFPLAESQLGRLHFIALSLARKYGSDMVVGQAENVLKEAPERDVIVNAVHAYSAAVSRRSPSKKTEK